MTFRRRQRLGLSHEAIEISDHLDLTGLVGQNWAAGRRVDYLIVDEAGFLDVEHVDQLADLVDEYHVDVYCFGLLTDFAASCCPVPSG